MNTSPILVAEAEVSPTADAIRTIVGRTMGRASGPVVRLMSPGDWGRVLKPFVFLDLFDAPSNMGEGFGLHPHSGIATVTVLTEGDTHFAGPASGCGVLDYGGVEWMMAGDGVWHGDELSPGRSERVRGFQLWIALPPELENAASEAQYLQSDVIPQVGPARIILGRYEGAQSPVKSPDGVNYLLVTLGDGERWTYRPPTGHTLAWAAVSKGVLLADEPVQRGEMVVFSPDQKPLTLRAQGDTCLVLGSAIPHPHDLVTGYYSVHTSVQALAKGEANIAALKGRMVGR